MIQEEILEYYYGEIANKLDEMIPVEWTKIAMQAIDIGTSRNAGDRYWYIENGLFLFLYTRWQSA